MSNSELTLVKDEVNQIEFGTVERQPVEFQEEFCEARAIHTSSNDVPNNERQVPEDDEEKKEEERNVKAAGSEESEKKYILLGELQAIVLYDDDDGFKTPTSMDCKITETKQCPTAPRKPKSNKRAASPTPSSSGTANTSTRRHLLLDVSQAVELWIAASLVDDLQVKKARTHER